MQALRDATKRFLRDEGGASLVEYAVLIGLISAALVTAISGLGGGISNAFNKVKDIIDPPTKSG